MTTIGELATYPEDLPLHMRAAWSAALEVATNNTSLVETFAVDTEINIYALDKVKKKDRQKIQRQFRWWFHRNVWGKTT